MWEGGGRRGDRAWEREGREGKEGGEGREEREGIRGKGVGGRAGMRDGGTELREAMQTYR